MAVAVAVAVDGTEFGTVRSCAAAAGDSYLSLNKAGNAAAAVTTALVDSYSSPNMVGVREFGTTVADAVLQLTLVACDGENRKLHCCCCWML
jgi:hypothetical protein